MHTLRHLLTGAKECPLGVEPAARPIGRRKKDRAAAVQARAITRAPHVTRSEREKKKRRKGDGQGKNATHPKSAMAMSRTLYSRPLTVSTVHIAEGADILTDVLCCCWESVNLCGKSDERGHPAVAFWSWDDGASGSGTSGISEALRHTARGLL